MGGRLICGLAASLVLTGCINDVMNTKPEVAGLTSALPVQTRVNPDSGDSVTLRPGGQLKLTLSSNPTTGYFWAMVDGDETLVALEDHFYTPDPAPEGLVGSGGQQIFTFTGVAPGKTTVKLSYQRSEEDVAETLKLKFKVVDRPL
ncbi:MAG: protease inhibitor I42 family protein [Pseudomonadota bacterium]